MMTTIRLMTTQTLMMVGTGRLKNTERPSVRLFLQLLCLLVLLGVQGQTLAQEALLPVRHSVPQPLKGENDLLSLPFFDDFSNVALSSRNWEMGGTFVNTGYAPLPPTLGMATLDAFDAEGRLYPTTTEQLFPCDTLASQPIRLDSIFVPYQRALTPADSVYLSFFYLPGGGYGNMWERVGDSPEGVDSLLLEFYDSVNDRWDLVWGRGGCEADSLFAQTGRYWQYVEVCISEQRYFTSGFRFRIRNYSSLTNLNKKGMISNADQWNVDYVLLDASRRRGDTASRDVAFVEPAPSMLSRYQAMPARQFLGTEMAENVRLIVANLFSEELATDYHYHIYDEHGVDVYSYDGGFENIPVYWRGLQYQTSPAHAMPPIGYTFPLSNDSPTSYMIVHNVREGVSGDIHTQNDSTTFVQEFDNYYAYDDGIPENGYGITSTSSRVKIAYRFHLNMEDTLTALYMYFNRTLGEENGDIRFAITVWDDANGVPGNIIYQDAIRRKPLFEGINQYVRYVLEEPVVCNGTVYVGFEQYSPDYINIGFDRNHDASSEILYLSSTSWQTSILRGALMIRPYFGQKATLDISQPEVSTSFKAWVSEGTLSVECDVPQSIQVYDALGRRIESKNGITCLRVAHLAKGLYLVKVGAQTKKVVVY